MLLRHRITSRIEVSKRWDVALIASPRLKKNIFFPRGMANSFVFESRTHFREKMWIAGQGVLSEFTCWSLITRINPQPPRALHPLASLSVYLMVI